MTWKTFHHRGETLRSVIATADVRCDGLLPLDVPGVAETFADELSLLAVLQLKWHTRLAGRIDRELAAQPLDLAAAVERAWREVADELPGIRAILDHYRAAPVDAPMAQAMAKATTKEHLMLATMAGRCSVGDLGAAPVGARLEERARHAHHGVATLERGSTGGSDTGSTTGRAGGHRQATLLRRLRALVAA